MSKPSRNTESLCLLTPEGNRDFYLNGLTNANIIAMPAPIRKFASIKTAGKNLFTCGAFSANELKAAPEIPVLRQHAIALMRDTGVVKLKIYRLGGITVFSTDSKQIGETAPAVQMARPQLAARPAVPRLAKA